MEPGTEGFEVSRLFFPLPDPLPFPDGTDLIERVGDQPHEYKDDDPWVYLRIHQTRVGPSREETVSEAVFHVTRSLQDLAVDDESEEGKKDPETTFPVTVVEALTQFSADELPEDESGMARDLSPRQDVLGRCFRLVADYARAYRLATGAPYSRLTYERLYPFVIGYSGWMTPEPSDEGDLLNFDAVEWKGPFLIRLEHLNLADSIAGPQIIDDVAALFEHWLGELRTGASLMIWRENLLSAQRAARVDGDFAVAVVLAQTASEVLLDRVLALLLWEEGREAKDASHIFDEGKILKRVKSEMVHRLGGDWRLDGPGPAARWLEKSMKLRHRVVHGGYEPTRLEAEDAVQSVLDLQTHVFDRLADRRNTYPRSTLMTIGQDGLTRRGLWKGKIREFAETVAPNEANWRLTFEKWLRELADATEL